MEFEHDFNIWRKIEEQKLRKKKKLSPDYKMRPGM